jgi:hypothetical protein
MIHASNFRLASSQVANVPAAKSAVSSQGMLLQEASKIATKAHRARKSPV